jgi:hypothetical protein
MRIATWMLGLLLTITLMGCGGGDSSSDETRINTLQVRAANADGSEVDLAVNVSYDLVEGNAYLKVGSNNSPSTQDYDDALLIGAGSAQSELIARRRVSATDNSTATVSAWMNDSLGQSKGDGFGFADANIALAFANNPSRQTTQLTQVQLEVIPGSYRVAYNETYKANEHQFRFKVLDQNNLSVSGLESNFQEYFSIVENGEPSARESIENAEEQSDTLTCYFVIDASNSISQAGSTNAVREAVSKLVVSLAPIAKLNYRQFATQVKTITSVRELSYNDTDRFTSLYAGIDQTLTQISQNTDNSQKVMIVFTDGEDNYSQNYYANLSAPNATTSADVYTYLSNRISTTSINGGLAIYTIGLGNNIDVAKLTELANLGKGAFVNATDQNALNDKFSEIYRLIKSTYALSYFSPNLDAVTQLTLQANINGATDSVDIVGGD